MLQACDKIKQTPVVVQPAATELAEGSCPKCQYVNKAEARFCKKCGIALFEKCPGCQEEIRSNSPFCEFCGVNVPKAKQAKAAEQAAKAKAETERQRTEQAAKAEAKEKQANEVKVATPPAVGSPNTLEKAVPLARAATRTDIPRPAQPTSASSSFLQRQGKILAWGVVLLLVAVSLLFLELQDRQERARQEEARREEVRRLEEAAKSPATSEDGRYKRSAKGVVYDTKTNLEWYVCPKEHMSWDEAKSWIDSLTVDGGGWRMPTIKELQSIMIFDYRNR